MNVFNIEQKLKSFQEEESWYHYTLLCTSSQKFEFILKLKDLEFSQKSVAVVNSLRRR